MRPLAPSNAAPATKVATVIVSALPIVFALYCKEANALFTLVCVPENEMTVAVLLVQSAEEYPVGFAEVIKRIKAAAGTLSADFHTL